MSPQIRRLLSHLLSRVGQSVCFSEAIWTCPNWSGMAVHWDSRCSAVQCISLHGGKMEEHGRTTCQELWIGSPNCTKLRLARQNAKVFICLRTCKIADIRIIFGMLVHHCGNIMEHTLSVSNAPFVSSAPGALQEMAPHGIVPHRFRGGTTSAAGGRSAKMCQGGSTTVVA